MANTINLPPTKHPHKFIRTFTHQVGTEYSFKYQIGIMIGREVRKSGKIRFLLSIINHVNNQIIAFYKNLLTKFHRIYGGKFNPFLCLVTLHGTEVRPFHSIIQCLLIVQSFMFPA